MKRSEIRKALEAWFDVERYEAIEKLSRQQFYIEVEGHLLAYRMEQKCNTFLLYCLSLDDYRNKILSGEILFSGDIAPGNELPGTCVVNPTT